jgi:hypothetical protein
VSAPSPLAPTAPYEPIPAEALDQSLAARFADVVRPPR